MSKNSKSSRKEQYMENRKTLIAQSKVVRALIETGEYDSVNEGLKDLICEKNPEITEFKTFRQWKEEGYTILKGSRAFVLWGQPRKVSQVPEGETEPEEYKYWPLCYLFANTQVYKREPKPAEPVKQEQEKPARQRHFPEPVNADDLM